MKRDLQGYLTRVSAREYPAAAIELARVANSIVPLWIPLLASFLGPVLWVVFTRPSPETRQRVTEQVESAFILSGAMTLMLLAALLAVVVLARRR